MNRNHHCINLQYCSSNIGISRALSAARNNCTTVLSWSQFMGLQFFFVTQLLWFSKKLSAVAKGKNDQEEESGHSRYEEKWPKQPSVHRLCQHPPLSADLIIFVLLILLVEETPDHPDEVILIVIRQTARTVHPDHVQLGAAGCEHPWAGRPAHPGPGVAQHAPHNPHKLLLLVLGDPGLLHLHEVQPRSRGADCVPHAPKEGVLLCFIAMALALRNAPISPGPRLPPCRLTDHTKSHWDFYNLR